MEPTVELAVDGFPLDPGDPHIGFHRELSSWLELDKGRRVPVTLQVGAPTPEERWDWLRASLIRFQWVHNNAGLLVGSRPFDRKLAELIALLINRISLVDSRSVQVHENELAMLASQGAALDACEAGSMFRSDAARLLLDLAKRNAMPATRHAIHVMLRQLPPKREPAHRMQELAWRLSLDDDDPDDGDPCWSAPVRRELKAFKPAKRKPWEGLLKLASSMGQAPDAKWEEKVKKALDRIGREEWESRILAWMARLQTSEPVILERSGQVLLRLAIEMSGAAECSALTLSLAALVDIRWDSPRSEAFWVQRIDWLSAHTPMLDVGQPSIKWASFSNWNNLLKSLRSTLLRTGVETDQQDLLRLLREGDHAAFERAADYTKQYGYKSEIVEAVRQYHATPHGSVSDQARRQHVGWWLWLEDLTPIKAGLLWFVGSTSRCPV